MKKKLVLAFIFSFIYNMFAQNVQAINYFEQGKEAFYKQNYSEAQTFFLRELQRNPRNYFCRYFLAHTYVYDEEITLAKEEYGKVITYAPNLTLKKLAMQSMYNLNNNVTQPNTENTPKNKDNYFEDIKLENNYVKWQEFPINVYVEPNDYDVLIKNAFSQWQKQSGGLVQFNFISNLNDAQITVVMTDTLSLAENELFEVGQAVVKAKDNIIYSAQIYLLKLDPKSNEELPNEIIYSTALHEIGHALGLQGHSKIDSDIMSAVNYKGLKSISQRDLNTLQLLYENK